MQNYKAALSFRIALDSGSFEWDGSYLRPTRQSNLIEKLGHSKEHIKQSYILPANIATKEALIIGGSTYSLSELSTNLNIPLDNYKEEKQVKIKGKKQHSTQNYKFTDDYLKYWKNHHIENPEAILKIFGIYLSEKTLTKNKSKCFVIPLSNGSFKYFILDENYNVTSKMTNFEGKNTIFPDLTFDNTKDVYIVESLADCIKLRELNYNCFCFSGGIQELYKISKFFSKREIYYISQTDNPAEKQENNIMKSFIYNGNITRLVNLPLHEEIKDICDYFGYFTPDDFKKLVESTFLSKKYLKDIAISFLLRNSTLINLHDVSIVEKQLKDYFLVYNSNKKMFPIFKNNNGEIQQNFNNFLKEKILPNLNRFLYLENEKIEDKNKHFEQFKGLHLKDLIHSKLLDDKIKCFDCQLSNLTVFDKKNKQLKYSSDIYNNVVITQDLINLQYKNIKPEYNEQIDQLFNDLYGNNAILIKAHIITSILNEDFGQKHLLFISGSSQIGKSKTSEFISRIITNNYVTFDIKTLPSIWQKFFLNRSPVLDNVDVVKNLDPSIASELAEIITASKTVKNVRYTQSGFEFVCDVYPIITTINDDLLDRGDMTPLKSRAIIINIKYNHYAKEHLNTVYNNLEIIDKSRLHFYYLAEQYLKLNVDISHINHRSKNFFSVLTFLDEEKAKKYDKHLLSSENYSPVVTIFLEMLNQGHITVHKGNDNFETIELIEKYYSVSEWTEYFHIFSEQKYDEKINERNLFKYNVFKYVKGDIISKYLINKIKKSNANMVKFTLNEKN